MIILHFERRYLLFSILVEILIKIYWFEKYSNKIIKLLEIYIVIVKKNIVVILFNKFEV